MARPSKNGDAIKSELKSQFDPDKSVLEATMERIGEAQQMDEFREYSHWENPEKLVSHLYGFSQEQGLKAGWNRWISVQEGDTARLKID
ncbi:hypothetical protein [Halostagnicola kamekurae]|uniref:Uncharacterized protein n=1 Tax=Halostagnicola kamekurae TaxID=619731 RepID=A0A1I6V5A1_9EURY|nr:hypothetical protein [Halostagnicola kamekurae]SFT08871.1 hypothetical protein SAMN04488556_0060 [Halostagnicola kamekurae]